MATEKKIMLVEDNIAFRESARDYFEKVPEVRLDVAVDYHEAMPILERLPRLDGAIFDCFFPSEKGSGDRILGRASVERMISENASYADYREAMQRLSEVVELDDELRPALEKYFYAVARENKDALRNPSLMALEKVSQTLGRTLATLIAKNTFVKAGGWLRGIQEPRDYYKALEEAIERDEANQPLVIFLAEKARELNIPFVLATSTYHHDILTQPIQDYAGKRGWTLIDCDQGRENQKSTPGFWERVYKSLLSKMEKQT